MRWRYFSLFLVLIFSSSPIFAEEKKDLADYYQAALDYSTQIKISEQEIDKAKARYFQALSLALPRANVRFNQLLQDTSGNDGNQDSNGNISSTLTRFSRPDLALNLQQTLFQGLKEFQALKSAKIEQSRAKILKKEAERRLFLDVTLVYFNAFRIELQIESLKKILKLSQSQLKEIDGRIALGKNRDSEAASQKTATDLLEAELEDRKGRLKIAYETLRFLTGLSPDQYRVKHEKLVQLKVEKRDLYVEKSSQRWDVQAVEKDVEIAKTDVKFRQGDLMPRVDLESNIYGYRPGFQNDIHWDALIQVQVPLFNGETHGLIREAKTNVKIAELKVEEEKRVAADQVRRNYENFLSSRSRFQKYQAAAQKAEQSYGLQSRDFGLGLIENLDVLQSQQALLNALEARNDTEVESWLFWYQLQTQAGLLP